MHEFVLSFAVEKYSILLLGKYNYLDKLIILIYICYTKKILYVLFCLKKKTNKNTRIKKPIFTLSPLYILIVIIYIYSAKWDNLSLLFVISRDFHN